MVEDREEDLKLENEKIYLADWSELSMWEERDARQQRIEENMQVEGEQTRAEEWQQIVDNVQTPQRVDMDPRYVLVMAHLNGNQKTTYCENRMWETSVRVCSNFCQT